MAYVPWRIDATGINPGTPAGPSYPFSISYNYRQVKLISGRYPLLTNKPPSGRYNLTDQAKGDRAPNVDIIDPGISFSAPTGFNEVVVTARYGNQTFTFVIAAADDLYRTNYKMIYSTSRVSPNSYGVIIDHDKNTVTLPSSLTRTLVNYGYAARIYAGYNRAELDLSLRIGRIAEVKLAKVYGFVPFLDAMANALNSQLKDTIIPKTGLVQRYTVTAGQSAYATLLDKALDGAFRANSMTADTDDDPLTEADLERLMDSVESAFADLDAETQDAVLAGLRRASSASIGPTDATALAIQPPLSIDNGRRLSYAAAIDQVVGYKYLSEYRVQSAFGNLRTSVSNMFKDQTELVLECNKFPPYEGAAPGQYLVGAFQWVKDIIDKKNDFADRLKDVFDKVSQLLSPGSGAVLPQFAYGRDYNAPIAAINEYLNGGTGVGKRGNWLMRDSTNRLVYTTFWEGVSKSHLVYIQEMSGVLYTLQRGYQNSIHYYAAQKMAEKEADFLNILFASFAALGYGIYLPGAGMALASHFKTASSTLDMKSIGEVLKFKGAVFATLAAGGSVAGAVKTANARTINDYLNDIGIPSYQALLTDFPTLYERIKNSHIADFPTQSQKDAYLEQTQQTKVASDNLMHRVKAFYLSFGEGRNDTSDDDMFGWHKKYGFDSAIFGSSDVSGGPAGDDLDAMGSYLKEALVRNNYATRFDDTYVNAWKSEARALGFSNCLNHQSRTVSVYTQDILNYNEGGTIIPHTIHGLNISLWYTNSNLWHFTVNDGYVRSS